MSLVGDLELQRFRRPSLSSVRARNRYRLAEGEPLERQDVTLVLAIFVPAALIGLAVWGLAVWALAHAVVGLF